MVIFPFFQRQNSVGDWLYCQLYNLLISISFQQLSYLYLYFYKKNPQKPRYNFVNCDFSIKFDGFLMSALNIIPK